jgi:hypothetical protein
VAREAQDFAALPVFTNHERVGTEALDRLAFLVDGADKQRAFARILGVDGRRQECGGGAKHDGQQQRRRGR